MDQKNAIVFGAAGGIGREIIKKLAVLGTRVYASYYSTVVNAGDNIVPVQIDVTNVKSVATGVASISRDSESIDAVVYAVSSPLEYKSVLERDQQDLEKHLSVQVLGFDNVVKSLASEIKTGSGIRFVIVLSEACLGTPPAGFAGYVAAKYALMGYSKCLAVELAKYNCTVNFVSPGLTDTELLAAYPPKAIEIAAAQNPLGRIAAPADVAAAVLFLLAKETSYLNGVNISVNGGSVML